MKLHHVYGPNDGDEKFIPWLLKQLLTKERVDLSSGMQYRDFIYIKDVVSAYISIIESHESYLKGLAEYIVSTGEKTRVRNFCIKLQEIVELKAEKSVAKLNFGEKYFEGEIHDIFNDNSDLLALNWKPEFTLDNGIDELVEINLNKYYE
jgi:nucleoside-diphosphate-sugar epimerase